MRDYLAELRSASFRGVPFFVESEAPQTGRRIISHEFPKRDTPAHEDMGAKAGRWSVKAYVAGDAFGADMAAILALAAQKGTGTLILPVRGSLSARIVDASATSERSRRGYAAIDLTFVEEGGALAPFVSILGARVALDLARQAAALLQAAVLPAVSSPPPGWAGESIRGGALDALAEIDVARISSPLAPDAAASLAAELSDVARSLDTPAGLAAFGGAVASAIRIFAGDTAEDATLARLEALAEPHPAATASASPSARAAVAGGNAIDAARAVAAYAEACAGAAARRYASRREVILWRSRYAALGARVQEAASAALDEACYLHAGDIRGNVVMQLSRSLADLAPTITPSANISLPASVWAWRLYRDPARAEEIVAMNGVAHPAFMPQSFEAASA